MKKLFVMFFATLLLSSEALAQQLQNKDVIRFSFALDEKWYGTVWFVGNIRKDAPDNANLFPGVGYKTSRWWAEVLWWQNWNSAGTRSALDGRFGITHPKLSVYSELSRFFETGDVYTLIFVEHPVSKKLRVGVETENFFREKNSLGAGPRASYTWGTFLKGSVVTTLSYQVRYMEPDALRLQFTWSPRF